MKYNVQPVPIYNDIQLERLVTRLTNKMPDATIYRAYSPTFAYGSHISCVVKNQKLETIGFVSRGNQIEMSDMAEEEIRRIIRKNIVFFLYAVEAVPYLSNDGTATVIDWGWQIRYAVL